MKEVDTSIPFPNVWELIAALMYWSYLLRKEDANAKPR